MSDAVALVLMMEFFTMIFNRNVPHVLSPMQNLRVYVIILEVPEDTSEIFR